MFSTLSHLAKHYVAALSHLVLRFFELILTLIYDLHSPLHLFIGAVVKSQSAFDWQFNRLIVRTIYLDRYKNKSFAQFGLNIYIWYILRLIIHESRKYSGLSDKGNNSNPNTSGNI